MPTREINLVSEKPVISQQEKYLKNIINKYLPLLLGIFIITTGITLGYNIILDNNLTVLEQNITSEKNKISLMEKNEGRYLMLKQKASAINTILSSNFLYDKAFEFAKSLEQQGGTLVNFDLSQTGEMNLSMKVENTSKMEELVNKIVDKAKNTFKTVELFGVVYKSDGSFDISLQIGIQDTKNL